ncbi:hypothetical protein [Streptomyces fractus]|uniref:hypothetical protein n=1 Tax=Streptomyces fractus TaxID=641806 RepID=UPI003CF40087
MHLVRDRFPDARAAFPAARRSPLLARSGSGGAVDRFAGVVREILESAGGPCWAGYRRG